MRFILYLGFKLYYCILIYRSYFKNVCYYIFVYVLWKYELWNWCIF